MFKPSSVAVIGASRRPGKVGHEVLRNLLACGYGGRLLPVNPNADEILGLKCHPSILHVREDVDLAVVVVPAPLTPKVAEECGEKGVKGLVVISAGFKETGKDGAALERELLSVSRRHGMRMVGPNCLGIIDTFTPLNASFAARMPLRGRIGFISQSGAFCTSVLDWSAKEGIGFSRFVSLGNKADLNETDFIGTLVEDENTLVVLTYVESIDEGSRFLKVAREATRRKPIVILKGGRSPDGARAVSSHTGTLAGYFAAYKAAFEQSGIIVANSVEEFFDLALALSTQPIPRGRGVAIVTNAGGPGIVATDACGSHGLEIAGLSASTLARLRESLPPIASAYNPIDVVGDARADRYRLACEAALSDENVDGLIVLLSPQAMTEPEETARCLADLKRRHPEKPILASFMGGERIEGAVEILKKNGIPNFPFPERAVAAMGGLTEYSAYLQTERGQPVTFWDIDRIAVRRVLDRVQKDGRIVLLAHEATAVVRAYGIHAPPTELATSVDDAVRVAESMGYPVVLKVASPHILHKTDLGGVALNLKSSDDVRRAFGDIMARTSRYMPKAIVYGITVQKQVPVGKELIVGTSRDVQFGHLVTFGLGGIYVDFLRDVSYRLAPLSLDDARGMVSETKAYAMLKGIRGERPSDIPSVINVVLRIGHLVTDFPEIVEIDINPLFVYEEGKGCLALDVKMVLSSEGS